VYVKLPDRHRVCALVIAILFGQHNMSTEVIDSYPAMHDYMYLLRRYFFCLKCLQKFDRSWGIVVIFVEGVNGSIRVLFVNTPVIDFPVHYLLEPYPSTVPGSVRLESPGSRAWCMVRYRKY
jgi:hypothetical protein